MSLSAEKGDMLLDVAWAYHDNEEPFQAYSFAEKSIDLFDDLDDEKGKAESIRNLAWLYTRNDEFITAEERFEPIPKLGLNVALATIIIPLHSFIEKRMSKES